MLRVCEKILLFEEKSFIKAQKVDLIFCMFGDKLIKYCSLKPERTVSFIVIEGLDGSGKSTQLELLKAYLKEKKMPYRYLHFPRLEEGVYGELIARFLRGEMGDIDRVDPYLVALIFAGDRADAANTIHRWIEDGFMVILDRYVYSNIAFQCAKLDTKKEKRTLMKWILELEYTHNQLPRPDLNLFLDVPLEFVRTQLNKQRSGDDRTYLRGEKDIHEDSIDFQEKVRQMYIDLNEHVNDLSIIKCSSGTEEMASPDLIFTMIKNQINI
jgi:dTMP kinase